MANKRIIDLPAAGSVIAGTLFEIDTGAVSQKATASQISDFVKTVAPSITQNVGVAFGVQQNNATGKTLIVVSTLRITTDHTAPGDQQMDIITNASTPAAMAILDFNAQAPTTDPVIQSTLTVVVAPGGWYKIVNALDPAGGNSIVSVWEIAL
jgi:hypothetical protein